MRSEEVSHAPTALKKQRVPVSVIIPCYRCSGTIKRAITSITAQTQWPLEIILVDDCSEDGTLDLLNELKHQHEPNWIQVITLPSNAGPASARNAGWEIARGDFIAFLDADDSWHRQKLQLQCNYMHQHPDIVLCGHLAARSESETDQYLGELAAEQVPRLQMLFRNPFVTPSVMVRRNIRYRFREGSRHMEDHLLWMEIALGGSKLTRLNAHLAYLHKAPFGESGLSAQLWAMEQAELANFLFLYRSGRLNTPLLIALWSLSLLKFARRLLIAGSPFLVARLRPR